MYDVLCMKKYPLYDVPYLVRDPNDNYMSTGRCRIRKRNQAVVDDYFVARDRGLTAEEARRLVATKHQISEKKVKHSLDWYYHEALKRKRYDFLEKFPPTKEHIDRFDRIFAAEIEDRSKITQNYQKFKHYERKQRNRLEESRNRHHPQNHHLGLVSH